MSSYHKAAGMRTEFTIINSTFEKRQELRAWSPMLNLINFRRK